MTSLKWGYCNEVPTEPIQNLVKNPCAMTSSDRCHCTLTDEERGYAMCLHLFDGREYDPGWARNKVCLRQTQRVPPQRALHQSEWRGRKIKFVAMMVPQHDSEKERKPRIWRLTSCSPSSPSSPLFPFFAPPLPPHSFPLPFSSSPHVFPTFPLSLKTITSLN